MEAIKAYKVDKEYSCSLCGKRFKDRHSRNRHRRQVKCTDKYMRVDLLKCTMCQKQFTPRSNRDRHQRNQHKNNKSYSSQPDPTEIHVGTRGINTKTISLYHGLYSHLQY